MLSQVVLRHLSPQFEPVRSPSIRYDRLQRLSEECSILLSTVAAAGNNRRIAELSFQQGAEHLPELQLTWKPPSPNALDKLQPVLARLNQVAAKQRGRVVQRVRRGHLRRCARQLAGSGITAGHIRLIRLPHATVASSQIIAVSARNPVGTSQLKKRVGDLATGERKSGSSTNCNSRVAKLTEFEYTFGHLVEIVEKFLDAKGVDKFRVYLMDYGAPIGYQIAVTTLSSPMDRVRGPALRPRADGLIYDGDCS